MIIGFLRHAEAEALARSENERHLTTKGLEQAAKVGRFCAHIGWIPEGILTSPITRARQTADSVSRHLGGVEVMTEHFLESGMSPKEFLNEIQGYSRFDTLLLVGHQPDLGEAIAALLGLSPTALRIRKASLTVLDVADFQFGSAILEFSIPFQLM